MNSIKWQPRVITIDADTVLFDFKTDLTVKLASWFDLSKEEQENIVNPLIDNLPNLFEDLNPFEDAIGPIKKIVQSDIDILLISKVLSRFPDFEGDDIQSWIKKYFGDNYSRNIYLRVMWRDSDFSNTIISRIPCNEMYNDKKSFILLGSSEFPDWDSVTEYLLKPKNINLSITIDKNVSNGFDEFILYHKIQ